MRPGRLVPSPHGKVADFGEVRFGSALLLSASATANSMASLSVIIIAPTVFNQYIQADEISSNTLYCPGSGI
jgi:hypothetical protein